MIAAKAGAPVRRCTGTILRHSARVESLRTTGSDRRAQRFRVNTPKTDRSSATDEPRIPLRVLLEANREPACVLALVEMSGRGELHDVRRRPQAGRPPSTSAWRRTT